MKYATKADRDAITEKLRAEGMDIFDPIGALLARRERETPDKPALSFQLGTDPAEQADVMDWRALAQAARQAANLFRAEGLGDEDVVALILPNTPETVTAMLGAMMGASVAAINPLLETEHIAAILRETRAKVVVALAPTPRSDIFDKAHAAAAHAPDVRVIYTVDVMRHLPLPRRILARGLMLAKTARAKIRPRKAAPPVRDFRHACHSMSGARLTFTETVEDRPLACFHTGGTTGTPKVVQHMRSGILFNAAMGHILLLDQGDNVIMSPLPLFHIFGVYIGLMPCVYGGGHMVMIAPAGYRAEGMFDNIWRLIEKYRASFLLAVPTAVAAMLQKPVDGDVSSLRQVLCGAAPLPVEVFRRFLAETGVEVVEGYGMTEATCLVSGNPRDGEKKVGSVGLPIPLLDVEIRATEQSDPSEPCPLGEIGEICIRSPVIRVGQVYTNAAANQDLFTADGWLRTGDLGRMDEDGYLWITGRAKDLIIRGGHNIDPALIEDAALRFPGVALAAAVGQPDAHAGEVPCLYVQPAQGQSIDTAALMRFLETAIPERAAIPKWVGVLEALPVTAVGKIFKPEMRHLAIARVLGQELADAGVMGLTVRAIADKTTGTRVILSGSDPALVQDKVKEVMGRYALAWELA